MGCGYFICRYFIPGSIGSIVRSVKLYICLVLQINVIARIDAGRNERFLRIIGGIRLIESDIDIRDQRVI